MPLVSVVVPAFDRAQTIAACVRSILAQQGPPLEVLVVDDGSSDGTAQAAQAAADARVRVLPNARAKGAQGARNTGILAARGAWIAFNDSDDEWLPGKLLAQMRVLEERAYAPDVVVHGNGLLRAGCSPPRPLVLPRTEGAQAYSRLLMRPAPMLQGLLASRPLLEQVGLLDESLLAYHEWDASIRLAREATLVHLAEPLFVYAVGEPGAISADDARGLRGYAQVLRKHSAQIAQMHGDAALQKHYQWLLARAVELGDAALVAALRREALELARMSGLRRRLFEWSCAQGRSRRSIAHRLAQLHDRARLLLGPGT